MDGVQWTGPEILSGEVRLIEQPLGVSLSPFRRDLLTTADAILYDRRLEAMLCETWPIGAYGEPLSRESAAAAAAEPPRALALARDGWRVLVIIAIPGDRPVNVVELRQRDHGDGRRRIPALRSPPAREGIVSRLFTANGLAG